MTKPFTIWVYVHLCSLSHSTKLVLYKIVWHPIIPASRIPAGYFAFCLCNWAPIAQPLVYTPCKMINGLAQRGLFSAWSSYTCHLPVLGYKNLIAVPTGPLSTVWGFWRMSFAHVFEASGPKSYWTPGYSQIIWCYLKINVNDCIFDAPNVIGGKIVNNI